MKSVGEVMSIGRGFEEAFQKALRMIDDRVIGFDPYYAQDIQDIEHELQNPTDMRIFAVASALKSNLFTVEQLNQLTHIDKWFLNKFKNIIDHCSVLETRYKIDGLNDKMYLEPDFLRKCKQLGFSDKQIAMHVNSTEIEIRRIRNENQIVPFVKKIDTVAAEWPCKTNYLYLTYNADEHDQEAGVDSAVVVLGSGVYRIGSSVEFDWCAVSCLNELKKLGHRTIMINYNPETVSTDYDMSDKLYFEELTFETVMTIYELERPKGIILSMGGQAANNIAIDLHRQKVKVLGTSPESIDNAENRFKFSRMLDNIGISQPKWKELQNLQSAIEFCEQVDYPVLVRPSYVLSGAAMKVAHNNHELQNYLKVASSVSKEYPVVISKFILDAKEIDIDAVAKDGEILCMAVSTHVENAGVHSGDATLITPPIDINAETLQKIKVITGSIAQALQVNGPMNLQLIAKDNELKVIECNLRVSRSFPFVSKTLDYDFIAVATQVAMGHNPSPVDCVYGNGRIGVKVAQFSFSRLTGADVLLGVEMVSTGEVACFGENKFDAYIKALMSTGFRMPKKNILLSIGSFKDKNSLLDSVRLLQELGFNLYASRGTADFYSEHSIKVETVDWCYEDGSIHSVQKSGPKTQTIISSECDELISSTSINQRTVADYLTSKHFDLVINIPMKSSSFRASSFMTQGYQARRIAIENSIPLITNVKNVRLMVQALKHLDCKFPRVNTLVDCLTKTRFVKLPGLIDVHVHLREPGGEHKEDIYTGTKAALAGGYTMVCAMPNTNPAVVDEQSLTLVENLYKQKALCDYGLYLGATANNSEQIPALAERACALKMYLNETFNALRIDKLEDWVKHFKMWPKSKPICCHSEEHQLAAVLYLAELFDRHVHICHVSTRQDIELIKSAKEKGLKVTCEVAPHHLFYTIDDMDQFSGMVKEVRPRLKSSDDRDALWQHFDCIDMIASDHAPHTLEEKVKNGMPGFPGLETSLILMITAFKQGKITLEQIIEKCCTNPRKIFNLPEQPDTYIEVDLDSEWTLTESMPYSKCKWTPFAGLKVFGQIRRVILRGEVVFLDGEVLAKPGYGKNLTEYKSVRPTQPSIDVTKVLSVSTKLDTLKSPQKTPFAHSFTSDSLESSEASKPVQILKSQYFKSFEPEDNALYKANFITVDHLRKNVMHKLFNLAHDLRIYTFGEKNLTHMLNGKVIAEMFFEPSTRTQCSFTAAVQRLGGSVIFMDQQNSSVKKGETLEDSVRMMSAYSDLVVIRHPEPGAAERATKISIKPVVNAGDGTGEHPTQALLDVFTIREEIGTVNGITVTMVGDLKHGRTVHSLAKLLKLYRVTIRYVAPDFLQMPKTIVDVLDKAGIVQEKFSSLEKALPGTDVLYMTRIQRERFELDEEYEKASGLYILTPKLMRIAKKKMIVMHPLPRVDEISTALDSDPRAAYFRQAEYGMFIRMALLLMILKQN